MIENDSKSVKNNYIEQILNPKKICVFGANDNLLGTMGSMQLRNIIAGGGFEEIYPIHPRLEYVQGFKAYKSVLDLPVIPDLAFIILPTRVVPTVMEECGQKGIKNLIITSGGFREVGSDGIELSNQIDIIAKQYNMRFIGPNCLGVFNGWYGYPEKENTFLNTFWIYLPHKRGNISIVSQSGTIAAQTAWYTNDLGVNVGKSISVGNERSIDIVDLLEYFKNDPQTEVIGLYIEEVKRGKKFIKLAKEISPKKPIVAIYAGGTNAAARSIMSHTGSISGDDKIYEAIFKESGIISTNSISDFLYYLRTLSQAQTYNFFPKGKRIGIITDSGGPGAMMTKTAELYGLEVPEFSKRLQDEFSDDLPKTGSATNPIDVTFHENFLTMLIKFPKILMKSGEVDSIIVFGIYDFDEVMDVVESSGGKVDEQMKQMKQLMDIGVVNPIKKLMKKYHIPVFYSGPIPYRSPWMQKFISSDVPIFSLWDYPTKCLAMLTKYSEYRQKVSYSK
ncbi:MAG: CoA-binding protein [Candidatus Lokiarchaeota archaeon]|nr:CoA-binding protein [Candidatus Lokiarchaeota archaeon]